MDSCIQSLTLFFSLVHEDSLQKNFYFAQLGIYVGYITKLR